MTRLQKKCLVVSVGLHLLLAVILIVGPAFLLSSNKADDLPVLDVIPANLIDKAFSGGGNRNAQPPPVAPPQLEPQPVAAPQPTPPQPQPRVVTPVKPVVPRNEPKPEKRDTEALEPKREFTPTRERVLKEVVRNPAAAEAAKRQAEAQARAQQLASARQRAAAQLNRSMRSLRNELSSSTTVDLSYGPGGGGEAYANYAQVVKSIYTQAWIPPVDTASDDANVRVTVTIANDGTVLSARILDRSGDGQVDKSIQRALDSVRFIAPFPEGAKERQRTYKINFNLKAKRLAG